jgi:AcrR family transcriptional regulator
VNVVHISRPGALTQRETEGESARVARGTSPVAARREARIDDILNAATALVVEAGLEALTLQRLGAELGMATTSLYRYFPGKTELVVALQVRAIAALAADVDKAIAKAQTPLDQIRAAVGVFLDGPVKAPARHHLIDAFLSAPEPQLDPTALAEVEAVLGPLLATVAACFDAAAAAGALEPGDGALRTRVLWAAAHGVHHLRRRDRIEPKSRRSTALARETVAALLRGWGAAR